MNQLPRTFIHCPYIKWIWDKNHANRICYVDWGAFWKYQQEDLAKIEERLNVELSNTEFAKSKRAIDLLKDVSEGNVLITATKDLRSARTRKRI